MWRIDPQKLSRVVDRCGQPVASVDAELEANANASLIAAAPDMFELLESLEANPTIPEDVVEEIKIVLRRARGDFGLALFSRSARQIFRARTKPVAATQAGAAGSALRIPIRRAAKS